MKNLLTIILIFIVSFLGAQTGPGGVGDNTNNIIWLDANQLGLANGAAVSSWTDVSGNANHAAQGTGSLQPIFRTGQINSLPAIDFDGTDDYLDFGTNITTQGASVFYIFNENATKNWHGVVALDSHLILARQFTYNVDHSASTVLNNKIARSSGYSIFSMATTNSSTNANVVLTQGGNTSNFSRTDLYDGVGTSSIGRRAVGNAYHMNANVPEVIIYNEKLDSASRNIVLNYLGAKYNLSSPNSGLYSYGSTHSNDVMGIGQESDGSNTTARGTDSLTISTPSSLGDGDYIMVGNDGGDFMASASVPSGITERWNRVWRADVTGSPGTISVEFFLNGGGLGLPANLVVLVENNDGDFSNGGTTTHSTGRAYSAGTNSITFTGLTLSDGDYFTLAEQDGDVSAVMDGLWRTPATWSCGCIPAVGDIVTIDNTFDVTIDSNAHALNLTINAGGSLSFSGSDTLTMVGPLSIGGTFTAGSATLAAAAASDQDFSNSSGGVLALNNFYINNSSGVDLIAGEWSVTGSLQVGAGNLDVTGATSMTLVSDATKTSQILESVDNAFIGDFTVQRFIAARNANYGNLSSPMEAGTPADLDDDLFISGIGGADGNATVAGGGTFYSMKSYNNIDAKHDTISSLATTLSPGNGFEIYLATTLSTFSATTIDYVGVPTSGDFIPNQAVARQFWNLLGNPYHAYIAWDSIEKLSHIPDDYYIFNTDNGSYDFFTGVKPLIAPHQGFWVYKSIFGGNSILYKEEDKVSGNTSVFLRKKNPKELTFNISSNINPFKHQMQFYFSPHVENSMDDKDAPFLPSPLEEAPAIFSRATNSNDKLIRNSLNSYESTQLVPLSVYTGVEGEYTIQREGVERLYENYSCAYLKDNETNEVIDLLVDEQYSFTSKKGTNERFNLILSNSYNECQKLIEDGVFEQNLDRQLGLRNANGQWYLDYTLEEENSNLEVRVFNMAGQEVRSPFQFSASNSGSLMINQLDGLTGIFVIQVKSNNEIINKTVKL